MSDLAPQFDPAAIEKPLTRRWLEGGWFRGAADAARSPYDITIPPPNVTGVLHMGHALNNTLQDVLIRKNRMAGRPTRWVLGTDHAGIATQNKVEQKLAKEGLTRYDIGREAFTRKCWEWRAEYGSSIVDQLKSMGCSCDYDNEWFTMNESYQRAVREVFVDWYDAGLIYRGRRIINWCPRCTTALSDIEVEHEEIVGRLHYLNYPLVEPVGGCTHITVATTRPETILGDSAIAVNPGDERYKDLVGSFAVLPLVGRKLEIVADDYVDPSFGTGAVKMTPAHDPNDFEVGQRHNLEQINIFDEKGVINELGGKYAGLDRYECRKVILADLEAGGFVEKIEEYPHAVGHCYRCHTQIEPYLSDQWFVDMKPLAQPAIEAVRDGRVKFHPERWANVYYHWMENIRDWCISRQLWWGHRIPVFYCDTCGGQFASKEDLTICPACGAVLRQDEDVLDTWFSSQLWPFATFGWPSGDVAPAPETPGVKSELAYWYPTSALSTAPDILFLWVARMIMSGLYFMDGQVPFADVIIHPTVFNKEGKRMSKSLGTGIDPLDLMETYGTDGMRFGLMLQVTGVQDMKFSEEKLLSSRNFANKIWNAARFVLMNTRDYAPVATLPAPTHSADRWILSRLATLARVVSDGIDSFGFGEVARSLYEFTWNEFCDWYIELAKGRLQGSPVERAEVQHLLVFVLDQILRLLHPMMPFITEEIWGKLPLERSGESAMLVAAAWPDADALARYRNPQAESAIETIKAVISALRTTRARYGISPKTALAAVVRTSSPEQAEFITSRHTLIEGLANVAGLEVGTEVSKPASSVSVIGEGLEIFIPLEGLVDLEAERIRLAREQEKLKSDLDRLERKLDNEGFLAKAAPEVVEKDRARAAELRDQLTKIGEQIADLG
ncbi:MAG: valine--tRNA ligase [Actinomycetia bacterium]|nr:valine--tRNA ligase [Actinomycetes bacterium]